ncbi:MAG TPA: thiolase family protein [Chthoniobacter sp.]|nr:thiolase family protein [Chthoniobacter sp.]
MNERMVIVDGVRTPFCKMGTDLASFTADDLGRIAVNALLTRTGLDPALIDEVIFGCVAQPAEAANIARVISLRAGIPQSVPAATVHRNCASGFESFTTAYERMCAGRGSIYIVGGTESMSHVPMLFQEATAKKFADLARSKSAAQKVSALTAFRVTDFEPRPGLKLGLTDPVSGLNMGETGELLAREDGITREQQDAFALQSHEKAVAAEAKLSEEMCPVYVGGKPLLRDNGPRKEQSMAVLGNLKPVFEKYGTVTAGNSSQITDGAVALLVMTESRARELGYTPLGALTSYAYAGCDPARMGLGPVAAMERMSKTSSLTLADADIIEINEAFASQVLAVLSRLKPEVPREKLNVNGGAIALGHPVGATGARLILTSLKELARRNAKRALVSLCVGGGQGGAIWLERI